METEQVLKCSECAAPIKPNQERCEYCGYWLLQPKPVENLEEIPESSTEDFIHNNSLFTLGIDIMIAFILAMIAGVIGIQLIPYVATAVGHSIP